MQSTVKLTLPLHAGKPHNIGAGFVAGLTRRAAAMRRLLLALLGLILLPVAAGNQLAPAAAVTSLVTVHAPAPPTPKGLPTAIEPLAGYVGDVSCDLRIRPGTRKLATLLATTYSAYGGSDWASTYTCGTDGHRSEHYDGRAIDWMVDVHQARAHAAAKAFLTWLLASDEAGNRFAMARRLGVMYVIYDNRMWGAWDGRWADYNNCSHHPQASYDNFCHRTHMHISLSWDGAMGRTSYWTRHVRASVDYGPCRHAGLNWAPPYRGRNTEPCPSAPHAVAGQGASAVKHHLVAYCGIALHRGSTGPAVNAVQAALGATATGQFDTPTLHAMWRFQRHHHLARTRVLRAPTWLTLLAVTK
jgi:hypothetical protein